MIESPSSRVTEKVPRWDITGTEGCGGGEVFFVDASGGLGIYGNICEYIGGRSRSGGHRGAHKVGGAPERVLD